MDGYRIVITPEQDLLFAFTQLNCLFSNTLLQLPLTATKLARTLLHKDNHDTNTNQHYPKLEPDRLIPGRENMNMHNGRLVGPDYYADSTRMRRCSLRREVCVGRLAMHSVRFGPALVVSSK